MTSMSMSMRTTVTGLGLPLPTHTAAGAGGGGGGGVSVEENWEMRPGGMLVQTRCSSNQNRPSPPTIRVRVKYGSVYHEINISSQATFGELKKMLTGPTGLHHEDQKLFFKDKERDSKTFLDTSGVKNKSKIVLVEDSISQEKRFLEMRTAKLEKASKSISDISLEVDRLAGQVAGLESVISRGGKVAENYLVNLIALLMDQLVKLDGIAVNVDAKVHMQRKIQVRRVQNYVETLDMLRVKNSMPNGDVNGNATSAQEKSSPSKQQERRFSDEHSSPVQKQQVRNPFGEPNQPHQRQKQQSQRLPYEGLSSPIGAPKQQPSRHSHELVSSQVQPPQQLLQPTRRSASEPVIITTQWETFDSLPLNAPDPPSPFTASTSSSSGASQPAAFSWDLL